MPAHSTASGTDLHEALRVKQPVRAASTGNVTLTAPGATIDGVTMVASERMLLKDQTAPAENGIYTWTGAATTATRTTDADAAADLVHGFEVFVREGTQNATSQWLFTVTAAITLGTTSLTFVRMAAPVVQSATAPALATSGTITTAGVSQARVAPAAAVTGVIMQAGTYADQRCMVVNESTGASTITMATAATSNVADGVSTVIAGLTACLFSWDVSAARWFRAA